MTAEIVDLKTVTTLDIPAERVLKAAMEADMDRVIIIGYDGNGAEYFTSSVSDSRDILWLMERAKLRLLRMSDED